MQETYNLSSLLKKWGNPDVTVSSKSVSPGQQKNIDSFHNKYPKQVNELYFLLKVEYPNSIDFMSAKWIICNIQYFHKHGKTKGERIKQKPWIKTKKETIGSHPKESKQKVSVNYYEYLKSPEWKIKSDLAKQRAKYRCQVCNRSKNQVTLHTHHRTYKNLGHEDDCDLTVLCEDCHILFESSSKFRVSKGKFKE